MKDQKEEDRRLGWLLKTYGVQTASTVSTQRLKESVVAAYGATQTTKISSGSPCPWVARAIAFIFLLWMISFVYFLWPISIKREVAISVLSFILGLWTVILWLRRSQQIIFLQ